MQLYIVIYYTEQIIYRHQHAVWHICVCVKSIAEVFFIYCFHPTGVKPVYRPAYEFVHCVIFYWVWTQAQRGSQCSRSSWRRSWGRPVCPGRTVLQTSLSRIFPGRWIRQNLHRGKNTKRDEGENLSESLCVYLSQNHFWKRLSLHERKTVCAWMRLC